MIKQALRVLIGLLIITISIIGILFLTRRIINLYDAPILKWIPLIATFIGFFIAGIITKKVKITYLLPLFVALVIFYPIKFFYFPFVLYLAFVAIWALVLNRKEITPTIKVVFSIAGISLVAFMLFNQPLIIRQNGFKVTKDGTLLNAKVLWDFNNVEPTTLPKESFINLNNEKIDLQNFKDKTVYISFWATWCGVCFAEKPQLDSLKEAFKNNDNVVFIDISLDKNRSKWESYLKKYNPDGIQLLSENDRLTQRNFEIIGIPKHLIVNSLNQYKSLREISAANKYLENEDLLNNWIQKERLVIERVE